jgi:hypothetical protein
VRIRQFGFLANRARREKLALCRVLLGVATPANAAVNDPPDGKTHDKPCPVCKTGHMILIPIYHPALRPALPHRLDSS